MPAFSLPFDLSALFDLGQLQGWLDGLGPWAWPVFLGLQVLQVVVFWIPGEVVQIAGGMVFGVWVGSLLSEVGISLGSGLAFCLARRLGKAWVERWIDGHEARRLGALVHHPRLDFILGLVFFLPFVPKDLFCYLAGLSDVKPWRFFWISTLSRFPSLVLSSWLGDLALHGWGPLLVWALVVGLVAGVAAFLYRRSLWAALGA